MLVIAIQLARRHIEDQLDPHRSPYKHLAKILLSLGRLIQIRRSDCTNTHGAFGVIPVIFFAGFPSQTSTRRLVSSQLARHNSVMNLLPVR